MLDKVSDKVGISRDRCAECRFFHGATRLGKCRRRAPVPGQGNVGAVWPTVHVEMWCGEYEGKQ